MSIVKISFESTVKRAKLSVSSFAELKESVSKLFPQLNGSNEFFIQYTDEVGDIVTVSDDDDVSVMMSDPSLTKNKIIISKNLMSNSEVNKQMMASVALSQPDLKMEAVKQSNVQNTGEIGVYPQIGESSNKKENITKVDETPAMESVEKPKKRLRQLKKKIALGTALSESELDEVKKLQTIVDEKKAAKKANKKDKKPIDPEMKALKQCKKKIKKPHKFTPAEVEEAKQRLMAKLETDPTFFDQKRKLKANVLEIKKTLKGLTTEEETELKTLQEHQSLRKLARRGLNKVQKAVKKSRSASKGKCGMMKKCMVVPMMAGALRPNSPGKNPNVKYPKMVGVLRQQLINGTEVPAKAQERICKILDMDPQAFKKMPRLRVLALKIKKANGGLTPEQEEELLKTQDILLTKPENTKRSCSRSASKGKLGSRPQSASKIQMLKRQLKQEKKAQKMKRNKVQSVKNEAAIDKRIQKLLPGIASALQTSMSSGEPINASIHRGFQCDSCKTKPIVGVRHTCKPCNFDLCSACVTKVNHEHPLERVESPIKRAGRPMRGRLGPKCARPTSVKGVRPTSTKRVSSTEKAIKKVVTIEEPKTEQPKAEEPKVECPEWLKPKRDQLVDMFGTDPAKSAAYILVNKFKPMEEIIDILLNNQTELAKLQ